MRKSNDLLVKATPVDFYDDSKEKRDPWIKHIRRAAKGIGADGKPLPEDDGHAPVTAEATTSEGHEDHPEEIPEEVPEGDAATPGTAPEAPARRPASPPGSPPQPSSRGRPAARGQSQQQPQGAQRPTTAYRPVLAPDLGKEYLIPDLQSPPPGVFALLGAKSKYESEEKNRDEAATKHAKQKTTFDGDDVDSDENDWVEDDGGLVEEGIIPTGMCAQQ